VVMAAVVVKPEHKPEDPKRFERDLREFVSARLADFKVPVRILFVDEIPKGPTGKIQRIGLAQILGLTPSADEQKRDIEPSNIGAGSAQLSELESLTLELCREVLNRGQIGINDNFFQVGGDSLIATRLMGRLEQAVAVKLSLIRLFETPTIAGLAQAVLEAREEQTAVGMVSASDDLERLLAEMELLSDEEAEQLLLTSDDN